MRWELRGSVTVVQHVYIICSCYPVEYAHSLVYTYTSPAPSPAFAICYCCYCCCCCCKQQESSTSTTKSYARFEVKAAGWDDKPIIRGMTDKIKGWITTQVGRSVVRSARVLLFRFPNGMKE